MFYCKIKSIKDKEPGFAILLVLIFGAIFSFLALSCWQQVSFLEDICIERKKFYANYYLTQNLYEQTINLLKSDFVIIQKKVLSDKVLRIDCTSWLMASISKIDSSSMNVLHKSLGKSNNLNAFLEIKPFEKNKNKLMLQIFLQNDDSCLSSISCLISKVGASNEHSENEHSPNVHLLLVEYFTLNNSF